MKVAATRIMRDGQLKPCEVDQTLAGGQEGLETFGLRVVVCSA